MPIWNNDSIIRKIFETFQLIHFTVLVKVNYSLYLIVVIIVILIIFFTSGIIVVLLIKIILQKRLYPWAIRYLQYMLPILSFGFYGQIFLLFTTVFYCRETESPTSPYLQCRTSWFDSLKPIAALAMILHFFIALTTNTLYYNPTFIKCKTDILQKYNSYPDVIFLFVKMIIITIFILDKGEEKEHWAIICFLILVTGVNMYFTLFYQNRKNIILSNLSNIFSLILFTGFLILLIGKIVKYWQFNGSIFLFSSLVVIIFIFFIFYQTYNPNFILIDYRTIIDQDEYLQYVLKFSDFVRNKNKSRDYLIIMSGLISSMEENCIDQECPLKKYLINLKNGIDSEYYLLQFVESLYQFGIAKFPENIFLKNYYSSFLIMDMNNKKKAVIVINDIKDKIVSLQMNYNIFRCLKIIEDYSSPFINKNNSIFNYRKDVQDFKANIENISLLYYDFLSSLLERKMENMNSFEKINRIGYSIKKKLKKAEKSFDRLIKIKIDNYEIIKLYSEFAENILNDEDKIEKCKNFLKIKNTNNIIEIQEKDYSNFNLEILKESDNFHYLIILTKNKELGNISDCSKNLCNLLGYTKNELIGKHINFLLPKIFDQKHREIIKQKSEEHKLDFYERLYTNSIYSPDFIEKDIYCISKSKLLIPLTVKIYLVNNEENELVYIAEFTREQSYSNDLLKKINNSEMPKHCVLTDKNFIIQSFTANCLSFLKLKYEDIGANYNILNFIKQFRQDYISAVNASSINKFSHMVNTGIFSLKESCKDLNLKTGFHAYGSSNNNNAKNGINDVKKMKLRKDIFKKKYSKKCKVTWNNSIEEFANTTKIMQKYHHLKNSVVNHHDSIISFDEFKLLNNFERDLYMETKSIVLGNKLIGYYFYFTSLYFPRPNNFFNYKVENRQTNIDKKIENKKAKKYQVIIKSKDFLSTMKRVDEQTLKKLDASGSLSVNRDYDGFSKLKFIRKSVQEPKVKFRRKSSRTYITHESCDQLLEKVRDDDTVINGDFVPTNYFNLDFNIRDLSYIPTNSYKTDKLNEIQSEAEEKMNKIIKIKFEKKRIIKRLFNSDSEEEEEESKEGNATSSSLFSSSSNSNTDKFSPKSGELSKSNSITKKNRIDRKVQNVNFNKKIEDMGNLFLGRNKAQIKKILKRSSISIRDIDYYHYYKIDLKRIKFMMYNYQREMIEEKLHTNYSEIETIIYNIKKALPVEIGRDEDYPYIKIKTQNKEKKEENDKTEINKNKEVFKIMDKDKILKRKIIEAINNYKDESPVKKLKILALISFIIMFGYGLLNFFFNTSYFTTFQELISLIQSSLGLKYCNLLSIFYIRELTLLNFKINEIPGGYYREFPADNKTKYYEYISNKLTNLYIENHALVKNILGSPYRISKNSSYYLTEELFDMKFITPDNQIRTVKYDMKKIILAYNTAFSNLAGANNVLEQNHTDIFNYFQNSFNEFEKGFDTLYDIYNYELEILRGNIKLYIYLIIAFVFISYSLIYFFGLKYFLSSNIIRISYIKIFYNINSKTLKDLMKNCLILIDKFKSNKKGESTRSEEEDEDENLSFNNKIKFNDINENALNDNESNQKNQNIYFSYLSLAFIILFFIFVAFLFGYFVFISNYFYNIYKQSLQISVFSKYFLIFQFVPMKIYNAYREFIFDNISIISNSTPYDYLRFGEDEVYKLIHLSTLYANPIIADMMRKNQTIIEIFNKNSCSFESILYFNLTDECVNQFGYLSRFNLDRAVLYFIEQLRIKKNIVKFMLDNYNVIGNLTEYNITKMINLYKENSNNNKTIFRLDLFNNEKIHKNINFLYFNIILENLELTRNMINLFTINGKNSYFIILIIIYVLLLCLLILVFFIPVIKFLNKQIYKAKNILSIVPINVLLYQKSNINLFKFFND